MPLGRGPIRRLCDGRRLEGQRSGRACAWYQRLSERPGRQRRGKCQVMMVVPPRALGGRNALFKEPISASRERFWFLGARKRNWPAYDEPQDPDHSALLGHNGRRSLWPAVASAAVAPIAWKGNNRAKTFRTIGSNLGLRSRHPHLLPNVGGGCDDASLLLDLPSADCRFGCIQ